MKFKKLMAFVCALSLLGAIIPRFSATGPIRITFLGRQKAGKTSIIKRMLNQDPDGKWNHTTEEKLDNTTSGGKKIQITDTVGFEINGSEVSYGMESDVFAFVMSYRDMSMEHKWSYSKAVETVFKDAEQLNYDSDCKLIFFINDSNDTWKEDEINDIKNHLRERGRSDKLNNDMFACVDTKSNVVHGFKDGQGNNIPGVDSFPKILEHIAGLFPDAEDAISSPKVSPISETDSKKDKDEGKHRNKAGWIAGGIILTTLGLGGVSAPFIMDHVDSSKSKKKSTKPNVNKNRNVHKTQNKPTKKASA